MNGLDESGEYDHVNFQIRNVLEEGEDIVDEYGLEDHGMVLLDSDGSILWKEEGHYMQEEDVRRVLNEHTEAG